MTPVTITSFGYLHGAAPEAHATFDARVHFKDPHVDPALRELTAEDPGVAAAVRATPGAMDLAAAIAGTARAFLRGPSPHPVVLAVGCAGGRHRSAVIAEEAARLLMCEGIPVMVTHRDIRFPVVVR